MINKTSIINNLNENKVSINYTQTTLAIIILLGMGAWAIFESNIKSTLGFEVLIGLAMGYVLQRSRFGFAGGVRRIYITGESSLTTALILLFSITILGTTAIHYGAAIKGIDIPGIASVEPASLATIAGGMMFGIGMMFSGGCASGTLTDMGEGEGRAFIVIIFFVLGALWGVHDLPMWKETFLFNIGTTVYLPDIFGYFGSLVISLLGFLGIYVFAKKYESKRRKSKTLIIPEYADWEKELPEQKKYKFFSKKTYHKFFIERWSFNKGAVVFSILFLSLLIVSGKSWGVTTSFAKWGGWASNSLGVVDISTWPWFIDKMEEMSKGFLMDGGSLRNIGLIIGSLVAALLAGRFSFKFRFTFKDSFVYIIGGLLMGYGSRIGLGCNAGALYSGITNFSLSGWVYLPAMVIGGIIGIKIVQKLKINM
ncbi:sulfur transport family protein [[Clostridium] bifermentans ATCC 638]|uniref:Sulfur transport family protein n=1 Tax=Paraclostridium bifermentans ATCC 638 = DSM 14991 TaxID=1233171 RepID=T4VQG8_PARBF|nr:YeeE/YedE family protein [Paraclostridium bifermentans]EQK43738.1 sulfur transport family protein [[Clostridium] bifermentans ATCC 638] [Paraclostridium bifermentans ATCC 638 = DSM 14991]RIZ59563.1 YeeE/YedE family protein [Paraclostridium bifermentans]UAG17573.1 YeeE/YedE family protein [Paraclostridium bifermentans]